MKSLYQIQEELKNKDLIAKQLSEKEEPSVKIEVVIKFKKKGELFMDSSKEYYEYIKEKYKDENLSLGEILYYEVLDDLQGKDSILNKEDN